MAGDWIKVEHSLPHKPEVMQLASILGIDEMTIVGYLVLFWSWVDQNLSPECPVVSGTKSGLDRVVGRDGFATAMVTVGWLTFVGDKIEIPNYEHHLSASAKKRAMDSRKKRKQRKPVPAVSPKCPDECPDNVPLHEGQNGGLEKRRVEKSKKEEIPLPLFETWWSTYPKRTAKKQAEKAYAKAVDEIARRELLDGETAERWLLNATRQRLRDIEKNGPGFVKHPATWLNAGCYDDEITTPVSRVATDEDRAKWNPITGGLD